MVLIFMFMLVFFFTWYIITYQTKRGQRYKLYPTAAAVGNTIYVRSQMTDSRQHVESTTLQPCCTAAAVRVTIYVRLACPRYAAASCLFVSEPVIICHPTIPHVPAVLPLWVPVSIDAET